MCPGCCALQESQLVSDDGEQIPADSRPPVHPAPVRRSADSTGCGSGDRTSACCCGTGSRRSQRCRSRPSNRGRRRQSPRHTCVQQAGDWHSADHIVGHFMPIQYAQPTLPVISINWMPKNSSSADLMPPSSAGSWPHCRRSNPSTNSHHDLL